MSNIYLDSDMLIELVGLKNADGEHIDNANVEVTLEFSNGNQVSGQLWPTTLDYDSETQTYTAPISADIDVRDGSRVVAIITTEADNRKATFYRDLNVVRNLR